MKTYRISKEEIKGLKPVAIGYKVFNNDWTSKSGRYDYKDDKEIYDILKARLDKEVE